MTLLDAGPLVGIIRYRATADLVPVLEALADAGIPLLEVTLDTPGALDAIASVAATGTTIGAGTVLDADQVRASADAGAGFVVSPGLVDEVVEQATTLGVEPIPGVLTPTELLRARGLGASAVKVFPAGPCGGPELIRALRSPFPGVGMLATGGIAVDDVGAYLAAGATAVGLGAALTGHRPPETPAELDELRARAAAALEAATR
ncbi:MAG TPA: bifunctional 4-hydroxy-2-oxoglutarate aldolase/2-dehydro-3-deoxy-phosphogluconate aldolase [Actinomycetota bacterium]|nr:bifunctional 4-hydroxy-2-oxoglutarate aldolase/2-dehydro-3-deoxy-phosphogluconate aldolase [Actinomycetota bacterium]